MDPRGTNIAEGKWIEKGNGGSVRCAERRQRKQARKNQQRVRRNRNTKIPEDVSNAGAARLAYLTWRDGAATVVLLSFDDFVAMGDRITKPTTDEGG
jgi:hypothetical protein